MLASVMIVSYNSSRYLSACLQSVFEYLPASCEVLVVDNASVDNSADIVARDFPSAIVIRNSQNIGFAAANNQAAERARGRYIIALNPDTIVTTGWLENLLRPFAMSEEPRPIAMTTPKILMMRQPGRLNAAGNIVHVTGITICRGLGRRADDPEFTRPCAVPAISGACFAMPRALWEDFGGFDSNFFMYYEDTDLSLRTRLAGYSCLYEPSAVIYHDYANSFSAQKVYYLERNRLQMIAKTYGAGALLAMFPALILGEVMAWGFSIIRGVYRAKLESYAWLLQNRKTIAAARVKAQKKRALPDWPILSACTWRIETSQLTSRTVSLFVGSLTSPVFFFCQAIARTLTLASENKERRRSPYTDSATTTNSL